MKIGKIDVGGRKAWIERKCALVGSRCLVEPPLPQSQIAEVDVGGRPIGVELQRCLIFPNALRIASTRSGATSANGTSARARAASIRTPRIGSDSSGAIRRRRAARSRTSARPIAAMRTDGSASAISFSPSRAVPWRGWPCASVAAAARTMAAGWGSSPASKDRGIPSHPVSCRHAASRHSASGNANRVRTIHRGHRLPTPACDPYDTACRHWGCRCDDDRSGRGRRKL